MYKEIVVPNLVLPDLSYLELKKAFDNYLTDMDNLWRADRQRLLDFYRGQQTDLDSYLKSYFDTETTYGNPPKYPHNLILSQVNMTGKIVDRKAKTYQLQPQRFIDGEPSETYETLLSEAGIRSSSKVVDRMTWLMGDNAVIIIADENKKRLRFDVPPYYRPIFKEGDMVNPIGIMYPGGLMANKEGKLVSGWHYWDADWHRILENQTWNMISEEPNPHGVFNVIFTHRLKPLESHWTRDAGDLIDMNRDINIALTTMNNALRYHGFPLLALIGIDKDTAKNVKVGYNQTITIEPSPTGGTIDVKSIIPSVDWDALGNLIKNRIELVANSWNVAIQWDLSGNLSSGVALKVMRIDDLDDLQDQQELYEEQLEQPMLEIIRAIGGKIRWVPEVEKGKLTINWALPETAETPTERSNRQRIELEMNITNPISIMMENDTDMEEAQAAKDYLRNVRVNQFLKAAQGGASEQDLLGILKGPSDQEIKTELGIEPDEDLAPEEEPE